jgi:hypothetical protein
MDVEPLRKSRAWRGSLRIGFLTVVFAVVGSMTVRADEMLATPPELASAGKAYIEWDHYPAGSEEHQRANYFYWFVQGTSQTLLWQQQICITGPVRGVQLAIMVAKYLNEHPETWQQPAPALVLTALQPTFPCPKPQKPVKR